MEMEAGLLSGLNQIIFVRVLVVAFVGITVSVPARQIEGLCVHVPKDTLYLIRMTNMEAANQTSYKAVKKTS